MLCVDYYVADSTIPGAGKGLFAACPIAPGTVIIAPTDIHETLPLQALLDDPAHPDADSSIRWFEDQCTVSPEWPDDCYVNHAFEPNGLWHLGFIFANRQIQAGEEICVDYRHLIGPGVEMPFLDAITQTPIVGLSWEDSLAQTTETLLVLARAKQKWARQVSIERETALA
jgi:hypothetical protein